MENLTQDELFFFTSAILTVIYMIGFIIVVSTGDFSDEDGMDIALYFVGGSMAVFIFSVFVIIIGIFVFIIFGIPALFFNLIK